MNLKQLSAFTEYIDYLDFDDIDKQQRVVFTTQRDNRVDDKICLELSGIAFDIDDPLRPVIPDDTHPNCRCYYVDEATGKIVTNISSRRDVKKRSKLTDRQRKNVIKKTLKPMSEKDMDLIVDTMMDNERWQKKIPDYPYKEASLELIGKWLKSV
tara:strand:- start:99 stop:563 length:465 start_codon:yes stop_codon:yes gene_type:complete